MCRSPAPWSVPLPASLWSLSSQLPTPVSSVVRWSPLLCVCLSPPLLAPPRPCLCGRKPPTFQSLDPACLGSPHTPSSSHFPELASVPSCSFLLPQPKFQKVRKRMEPAPQGILGQSLCPGTTSGSCRGWALLPSLPPDQRSGQGRPQGLLRLLLPCGHRGPHTLWEEAFPPFVSSRHPPVPRSPTLPSKPLPQMQMSVCACLWGHMRSARVWLCVQP